jgi:hypothetical protein
MEVSGQLHAPATLPPGKSPRYPFYRRLGGPQSRSGRYGEVKIFFFYPTGTRNPAPPDRPACSQSLYRLSYPGSQNRRGRLINCFANKFIYRRDPSKDWKSLQTYNKHLNFHYLMTVSSVHSLSTVTLGNPWSSFP